MTHVAERTSGLVIFALVCLAVAQGCSKDYASNPVGNSPPETHIFIDHADSLAAVPYYSRVISWYGDDSDGKVVGYETRWPEFDTTWTWVGEIERDTVDLPTGESGLATWTFQVRAKDNEGAWDPTPAEVELRVKSERPWVQFMSSGTPIKETFSIATFKWKSTDPDGDETIKGYQYKLATDEDWRPGPDSLTQVEQVTLYDIPSGEQSFTVRVMDGAGAVDDTTYEWTVLEKVGQLLVIKDDNNSRADTYYESVLTGIPHSTWKIFHGLPATRSDFKRSIDLFDAVFWYIGTSSSARLSGAELYLRQYIDSGGKLMLVGGGVVGTRGTFPSFFLGLFAYDYLHLGGCEVHNFRINAGDQLNIHANPILPDYPDLTRDPDETLIEIDGMDPRPSAEPIYTFPYGVYTGGAPSTWTGSPIVGIRHPVGGPASLIVFTIPLELCDDSPGGEDGAAMMGLIMSEFGVAE
jgi:hypothetical protein